jgi:hypothetical protein
LLSFQDVSDVIDVSVHVVVVSVVVFVDDHLLLSLCVVAYGMLAMAARFWRMTFLYNRNKYFLLLCCVKILRV